METAASDLGLLVLRGAVGAVMLAHGWNHIWGGGKIAGTARWFASLGMKPGRLHAWVASVTELVAGALLLIGLMVPIAAAAVIGVMTVAFVTNHRGNGFFIFRPGEGWEYVMTLTAAGVALAGVGGGGWSLDAALDVFDPPGTAGLVVGAAGGFGGAFGLLVAFWRPVPADPAT